MGKSRISGRKIGLTIRKPLPKQTEKVIPDKTKYNRLSQPKLFHQCPYDIAIKCRMEEPCLGCEDFEGQKKSMF